jgi:hypothetical protein
MSPATHCLPLPGMVCVLKKRRNRDDSSTRRGQFFAGTGRRIPILGWPFILFHFGCPGTGTGTSLNPDEYTTYRETVTETYLVNVLFVFIYSFRVLFLAQGV